MGTAILFDAQSRGFSPITTRSSFTHAGSVAIPTEVPVVDDEVVWTCMVCPKLYYPSEKYIHVYTRRIHVYNKKYGQIFLEYMYIIKNMV